MDEASIKQMILDNNLNKYFYSGQLERKYGESVEDFEKEVKDKIAHKNRGMLTIEERKTAADAADAAARTVRAQLNAAAGYARATTAKTETGNGIIRFKASTKTQEQLDADKAHAADAENARIQRQQPAHERGFFHRVSSAAKNYANRFGNSAKDYANRFGNFITRRGKGGRRRKSRKSRKGRKSRRKR